jgi:hypothetical protein
MRRMWKEAIMVSMGFEVFMAMKIQVEVFWAVMPCSVTVGCLHFRGPPCLHLHAEGPLQHYTISQPRRL